MAIDFAEFEKLPDDVEYVLPDGRKFTLGELRGYGKEVINKRIGDLTPREQRLAEREKALEEEGAKLRAGMAALGRRQAEPALAPPLGYTREQWDIIQQDQYSRPIVESLAHIANELNTLKQSDQQRRMHDEQQWMNYQMDQFAQRDSRFKDPAFRKAFLDRGTEVLLKRDLSILDRGLHFDEYIKSADEAAYKRGLEEGSRRGPVPPVPYGMRGVTPPPAEEKLPSDWHTFHDQALQDPELHQTIEEERARAGP